MKNNTSLIGFFPSLISILTLLKDCTFSEEIDPSGMELQHEIKNSVINDRKRIHFILSFLIYLALAYP